MNSFGLRCVSFLFGSVSGKQYRHTFLNLLCADFDDYQVRDVRAASPNDPQSCAAYPVALLPKGGVGMGAHRRCDICDVNLADKVCVLHF